jgi:acetyl esterase/lipase
VDYANRRREAGVPTQLEIIPGAFHGFDVAGGCIGLVPQLAADRLVAVRQFLAT